MTDEATPQQFEGIAEEVSKQEHWQSVRVNEHRSADLVVTFFGLFPRTTDADEDRSFDTIDAEFCVVDMDKDGKMLGATIMWRVPKETGDAAQR